MEFNCKNFNKKINEFLNDRINDVDFKKFYYHLKNCSSCYDVLLDEYIFHAIYNDYDKTTDMNYRQMLNNSLDNKLYEINNNYKKSKLKYIIISVLFYFFIVIIIGILLRNIYL